MAMSDTMDSAHGVALYNMIGGYLAENGISNPVYQDVLWSVESSLDMLGAVYAACDKLAQARDETYRTLMRVAEIGGDWTRQRVGVHATYADVEGLSSIAMSHSLRLVVTTLMREYRRLSHLSGDYGRINLIRMRETLTGVRSVSKRMMDEIFPVMVGLYPLESVNPYAMEKVHVGYENIRRIKLYGDWRWKGDGTAEPFYGANGFSVFVPEKDDSYWRVAWSRRFLMGKLNGDGRTDGVVTHHLDKLYWAGILEESAPYYSLPNSVLLHKNWHMGDDHETW
jgi:hypothetical protein